MFYRCFGLKFPPLRLRKQNQNWRKSSRLFRYWSWKLTASSDQRKSFEPFHFLIPFLFSGLTFLSSAYQILNLRYLLMLFRLSVFPEIWQVITLSLAQFPMAKVKKKIVSWSDRFPIVRNSDTTLFYDVSWCRVSKTMFTGWSIVKYK